MSYTASGSGEINFVSVLDQDTFKKVTSELKDVFDVDPYPDVSYNIPDEGITKRITSVNLYHSGSYDHLKTAEVLDEVAKMAGILTGLVDFRGENGECWRFIYNSYEGKWVEECSKKVFNRNDLVREAEKLDMVVLPKNDPKAVLEYFLNMENQDAKDVLECFLKLQIKIANALEV